jgi:hypothetical protein
MTGQMPTTGGADAATQRPSNIDDVQAHQYLDMADAHLDAGELADALRACDRAIEIAPEWAEAHNLRGIVLDEMGRGEEAIAAYKEAVRLDADFQEAAENLAEARVERGRRPPTQKWQRAAALGLSLVVLLVTIGVVVAAEARRGPDWRLELDDYVARSAAPSETVTIHSVVEAGEPQLFHAGMGSAVSDEWPWGSITPSFPPRAVQCVLLERSRGSGAGGERASVRQVVFVVHHSDMLYRVGWLAYEGSEEPFSSGFLAHLSSIGCDLGLK